jgi:predicted nucleic acid-binding protein
MATTESPVVCDAGPIIYLDEIGCLDLSSDFTPLIVPAEVWEDVSYHRQQLGVSGLPLAAIVTAPAPSPRLITLSQTLVLGAGERAALALGEARSARLFLCDDAGARLAAETLSLTARGTLGILTRSIRRGSRSRDRVLALLRDLPGAIHPPPVSKAPGRGDRAGRE